MSAKIHRFPKAAATSLVEDAASYGSAKVAKAKAQSLGLAVFAGVFIAIAFIFYTTVTTGAASMPWGMTRLAGGLAFSLGLMLVVVCGGELFTSTVLSSVAWAEGHVRGRDLLTCWARVYLGNLIGAFVMLALVLMAKLPELHAGSWGVNVLNIAQHKIHHSWLQAFSLGLLCNMLVCLGIWMTFTCKESWAKSLMLILPVAMFVSTGFEHSIANMFMVPLGIMTRSLSGSYLNLGEGVEIAHYADLTWLHFVMHNLIPVTLGNIVGGAVFIGLGNWYVEQASGHKKPSAANALSSNPLEEYSFMYQRLSSTLVADLMEENPFALNQDITVKQALSQLVDYRLRGAPVVAEDGCYLGFLSEQDLLRLWWSEEFDQDSSTTVESLVKRKTKVLSPNESLIEVLELMIVNKDKLYPVNGGGFLMSHEPQSFEQRLLEAASHMPSQYPVVENGRLLGMLRRSELAAFISRGKQVAKEGQAA
ncbi:formate transporter FocA [Aliagarivorans marinus]|uniref:formate transporter FocA n=1 Tax=Aliagarivorans marinus TaxID=561965 RepID=UPI0003FBF761|nr:formate transporter FocA [Aliagarivorans marinus]